MDTLVSRATNTPGVFLVRPKDGNEQTMHFYLTFSIDVMAGTCRITVSMQSSKIVGQGPGEGGEYTVHA